MVLAPSMLPPSTMGGSAPGPASSALQPVHVPAGGATPSSHAVPATTIITSPTDAIDA
jgi:hypothetical protein